MWNAFYSSCYLSLILFGTVALIGCGGASTGLVSGTVTIEGQPVDGLELEFIPIDRHGASAMAYTRNGGNYDLIHGRGSRRFQIPTGEYRVTIRITEDVSTPSKLKLGRQYTSFDESILVETIETGQNVFDFDLEVD